MLGAVVASYCSKDTSSKVGAVVVSEDVGATLSTGYNGLPIGVDDTKKERFDRPLKYEYFEHAEANAIHLAARNGVKLNGATMFITATPCAPCARAIIQAGIKKIVIPEKCAMAPRLDTTATFQMLLEAGVEVVRIKPIGAETFVTGQTHII